jgi:hypothetical protein
MMPPNGNTFTMDPPATAMTTALKMTVEYTMALFLRVVLDRGQRKCCFTGVLIIKSRIKLASWLNRHLTVCYDMRDRHIYRGGCFENHFTKGTWPTACYPVFYLKHTAGGPC